VEKSKTKRKGRGRLKAHIKTEEDDNSTDTKDLSSGTEDDEALKASLQTAARKTPMSRWIADTGASAHLTDQLSLFRRPLRKMKGRVVHSAALTEPD
jgi:hypothetical protein